MNKKILDYIIFIVFVVLITLSSGQWKLAELVQMIWPYTLIMIFGLSDKISIKVNFMIFFIILFTSLSLDTGIINLESSLFNGIFASVFALLFSFALMNNRKNKSRVSLQGTFLGWLVKKKPGLPEWLLFIIDSLVSLVFGTAFLFLIFRQINITMLILLLLLVCYISASHMHDYIVKDKS